MTIKPKLSHLQTPEVRAKRAKAIRAAFARKRKEARAWKGDVGTALIPLDAIPDRVTPARQGRRADVARKSQLLRSKKGQALFYCDVVAAGAFTYLSYQAM